MDRDFFYKPFFDVKKFMEACGQSTLYAYDTQIDLYKKLIDEEYGEFQEAFKNNDEAEQIDACFDMMWVTIGYLLSKGLDPSDIWDVGALSNLKKISESGQVIKNDAGKVQKPQGWEPPNFKQFVK